MNIDDRLFLPFPFYDDLEKQAFRQLKCNGNLNTFQILTDIHRFPPFEMRVTACTGAICDWELYDTADNLIADLDAEYDICDFFDYDIDGDDLIIQYDGTTPFDNPLPPGQYYIKASLGDGGLDPDYECGTFYSEVVTICPCDPRYDSDAEPLDINLITLMTNAGGGNGWAIFTTGLPCDGNEVNRILGMEGDPAYAYSNQIFISRGEKFLFRFYLDDYDWGDTSELTVALYDGDGNLASNIYTFPAGMGDAEWTEGDLTATTTGYLRLRFMGANTHVHGDGSSLSFNQPGEDGCNEFHLYRYNGVINYCEDSVQLEYLNSCDIGDIYYAGSWTGPRVIFQPKIDMTKPEYEITKDAIPRDGYLLISKITTKKKFKLTFYAPEFMADAMSILPSHDTITITDKFGDSATIKEIDVAATPTSHCFFKIELTFYIDPENVTNCCT